MKISINWLRDILPTNVEAIEIADRLSVSGLEVEHIDEWQSLPGGLKGFVVGEVLTCEQHPNADRLRLTTVNIGAAEPLHIVCGAPNVAAGQKVIVATVGTEINMKGKEPFVITKSKIRGEASEGMICAEDEMGMGSNHDGILVLPNDVQVGTTAADYFGVEVDTVIEIGLTANRGDAASHLGVARDLAGLLGLSIPQKNIPQIGNTTEKLDIQIADSALCERYYGIKIEGVQIAPSPQWLQNRLRAIDIEPKNNVVDATNYILHSVGQPVHAFDADKISGNVSVRKAVAGEKIVLLDGNEKELNADDIVIADASTVLAIAGVMGGKNSSVSENTTNLFLEIAHFHPGMVRKTAKRHVINTDASFRFERGIDKDNIGLYGRALADLIVQIAGGNMVAHQDVYPVPFVPQTISLSIPAMNAFSGIEIPQNEAASILKNLGFGVAEHADSILVTVPSWRNDVSELVDLYEEVMRIYGFDKIPMSGKMHVSLGNFEGMRKRKIENKLRAYLVSQGVFEASTNSLTTSLWWEGDENLVQLSNPLSSDMGVMRKSIVPGLLQSVAFNKNRQADKVALFEIGRTYEKTEQSFKETPVLTMVFWGKNASESWESQQRGVDFFDIKRLLKGALGVIDSALNVEDIEISLVKPNWLKKADLSGTVFSVEIPLKKLLKSGKKALKYVAPPKFPSMRRDLSLVLDTKVTFGELQKIIKAQKIHFLTETKVFSVFEGKPLDEGKKAIALSFLLNKADASLTDKDADAVMQKLMTAFEQSGAVIRR
jgi:phenylalanyl-tRNA synthetase beta chain